MDPNRESNFVKKNRIFYYQWYTVAQNNIAKENKRLYGLIFPQDFINSQLGLRKGLLNAAFFLFPFSKLSKHYFCISIECVFCNDQNFNITRPFTLEVMDITSKELFCLLIFACYLKWFVYIYEILFWNHIFYNSL